MTGSDALERRSRATAGPIRSRGGACLAALPWLALALSSCSPPGTGRLPAVPADVPVAASDTRAVVKGARAFGLDLWKALRREGSIAPGENFMISPLSVSMALAMTYAGARGETRDEMASVCHFDTRSGILHAANARILADILGVRQADGVTLSLANALFPQTGYDIREDFLATVRRQYASQLNEVDYADQTEAARQTINRWVEHETRGKIRDLFPPGVLNQLTRLVLVNAVHFKAPWQVPFEREETAPRPFTLASGEEVAVPTMHREETFGYARRDGLEVLEMPYWGERLSLVILLPERHDGLPALEDAITPQKLSGWTAGLSEVEIHVYLPRFTFESRASLNEVLVGLGMESAFDATRSDFSGIDGGRDLFIQAVVHKTFVEVNEEGTEAAAATGAAMGFRAVEERREFRADHPFLFLIRDRSTDMILFFGRVVRPG